MDAEIIMIMTVFIAERKPVNQLPEASEKEYEDVWVAGSGGWRREVGGEYMATARQGRGCPSQKVAIIRHNQV